MSVFIRVVLCVCVCVFFPNQQQITHYWPTHHIFLRDVFDRHLQDRITSTLVSAGSDDCVCMWDVRIH